MARQTRRTKAATLELHVEIIGARGDGARFDGECLALTVEALGEDVFRVPEQGFDRRQIVERQRACRDRSEAGG